MEYSFSYFRLFFPEVLEFTLSILKRNIVDTINDELAIDCYERALDLGFSPKEDSFFLRQMAELYKRIGDLETSKICYEESLRVSPESKNRNFI